MSVATSIMLCVISGTTVPGKRPRPSSSSMSGLASTKSKSLRLTSCNSNSTPSVREWEILNGSSGILALLLTRLARPAQRLLCRHRAEHLEQQCRGGERRELVDQVNPQVTCLLQQEDHEDRNRHQTQAGQRSLAPRRA